MEKIIKTQKQFDEIKDNYEGEIVINDTKEPLIINRSFENAYINIYGNATIKNISGNATIQNISGNAIIKYVYSNATIQNVYGNATIQDVYGNATITLFGLAIICFLYNAKKITTKGINIIRQIGIEKIDMKLSKETTFIKIKDSIKTKPTFDFYKKMYPVEVKKSKLKDLENYSVRRQRNCSL